MECRVGGSITFDFVHIIIESMLPTLRSDSMKPNICEGCAKGMFTTEICVLVSIAYSFIFAKNTFSIVGFVKVRKKALKN